MTEDKNTILGYLAWHPEHGFHAPYHYEGALAYVRSDDKDLQQDIRELNQESGQNNRTGWRIVPAKIARVLT